MARKQVISKSALYAQVATKIPSVDIGTITNILNTFQDVILENINNGYNSSISGFLTFETIEVAQRVGKDSKTKEKVTIPACRRMNVKVGNKFQERIIQDEENNKEN